MSRPIPTRPTTGPAGPKRVLATLLATLCLVAGGAAAQSEQDPQFGASIEVNVVNVDVRVSDSKGEPVVGLGPADFQILEDGEPVDITNFYAAAEVEPGSFEAETPVAGEPAATDSAAAPHADPAENLWLVIYVDNSNVLPNRREAALEAVRGFVTGDLGPRDQVMVVAFSDEVRVLDPFTTDRQRTLAALDQVNALPARGIESTVAWRRNLDRIQDTFESCRGGCDSCWEEMAALIENYGLETEGRARAAIGGLGRMVGSLAGVKGRKAILYLSDGLAMNPGAEGYQYLAELCPRQSREAYDRMRELDLAPQLEAVASWANSARITFYSLETSGLRPPLSGTVENSSLFFQPSQEVDDIRVKSLQDTLYVLADETGGKAALNANRLEGPLDQVARDLAYYYSLGYSPSRPPDGERHKIEVKLVGEGRKDWQIRYRTGYRAKPREEVLADQVLAALLLNLEANPLEARISTGEPTAGEGKGLRVPLRIAVPLDRITLVPTADGALEAHLRVLLATTDGSERVEAVRQRVLPIRIPATQEADLAGKYHAFEIGVTLTSPKSRLAVGIVDEVSGVGSFGEQKIGK